MTVEFSGVVTAVLLSPCLQIWYHSGFDVHLLFEDVDLTTLCHMTICSQTEDECQNHYGTKFQRRERKEHGSYYFSKSSCYVHSMSLEGGNSCRNNCSSQYLPSKRYYSEFYNWHYSSSRGTECSREQRHFHYSSSKGVLMHGHR